VSWAEEILVRLIGPFGSPYARRVAITLELYGLAYEHTNVIPFGDGKVQLRDVNPLARVPVLELDSGECIVDSATIIDYLDGLVNAERRLTSASGAERREVLNSVSIAGGATDKLVTALYEFHFRPKEMVYRPWIDMCERQVSDGFKWLDQRLTNDWFVADRLTQADVSTAVFWQFGREKRPGFFDRMECKNLQALSNRLGETSAFQKTTHEGGLPKGLALG
jgi:glutathione S-transferase